MTIHIALVFGMLGTLLLALDVAKSSILRRISIMFRLMKRVQFRFDVFFKDDLTKTEQTVFSTIKTLSVYSSLLGYLLFYPLLENESTHRTFVWIFFGVICFIAWFHLVIKIADHFPLLLKVTNWVLNVVLFVYFVMFSLLGVLLQFIIGVCVSAEKEFIGTHQAPRFFGVLLLFVSFALQFLAQS
ncbi:hypothetical protein M2F98_21870 [Vibrio vulnificus]|nr:hypothetical protein [Vibrio vulnificus]